MSNKVLTIIKLSSPVYKAVSSEPNSEHILYNAISLVCHKARFNLLKPVKGGQSDAMAELQSEYENGNVTENDEFAKIKSEALECEREFLLEEYFDSLTNGSEDDEGLDDETKDRIADLFDEVVTDVMNKLEHNELVSLSDLVMNDFSSYNWRYNEDAETLTLTLTK